MVTEIVVPRKKSRFGAGNDEYHRSPQKQIPRQGFKHRKFIWKMNKTLIEEWGRETEGYQPIGGMLSRPITTMGKQSLTLQADSWT